MLRGGTYVPNGPAQNAGVPTGLPINLSQTAGAIKTSPLSASVSPTTLNGSRNTAGVATTTASSTCTPSGQTGTVTYSWNVTTTSGNAVTATAPTSQTTSFQATVNNSNIESDATATCTAHDSGTGGTYVAGTVSISLIYNGP